MLKPAFKILLRLTLVGVIAYGLYLNLYGAWGPEFQPWLLLFYTTQSNALVMLLFVYLCVSDVRQLVSQPRALSNSGSPTCSQGLKIAFTWAIAITGIVWHLLLVPEMAKQTHFVVSDQMAFSISLLHTWSPLLAFADWLLFDPKNSIQRFAPFKWLLIPLAYFAFISFWVNVIGPVDLDKGLVYPYPFLDFGANGVAKTWFTLGVILIGMLTLGYVYLGLDKLMGKITRGFKY